MPRSNPRAIFGIHSVTPYRVTSRLPFGQFDVLEGSTLNLTGEVIELRGGSNRFPWAAEDGNINAELSLSCSEYPDFLFELFLGKAPTVYTAESSGDVSDLEDVLGTSVVAATGLLATITVSTPADLKFGKYVLKATGVSTAELYLSSNIDQQRGTPADDFINNELLIATITGIGTGSTHIIADYGITLTAGASAGAMVTGDTAAFEVRPINNGASEAVIGGLSDVFPSFGAYLYAQKRGTGQLFEIDAFLVKGIGCALGAQTKAWANYTVTGKLSYDSKRGGLFKMRAID